jgi:hypothetical protein
MAKKAICPACGKKRMVRKELKDGRYMLICEFCGTKRGPLKEDKKKGVV